MALHHNDAQLALEIEDKGSQEHRKVQCCTNNPSRSMNRQNSVSWTSPCRINSIEETLINQINKLTLMKILPTTQITQNLAEEINKRPVEKKWHPRFIYRHHTRLYSLYIRNMDHTSQKAEYKPLFQIYFDLLCNGYHMQQ